MNAQKRQPKGQPIGGRFAARSRTDSDALLADLPTQGEERRLTRALDVARGGNGNSLDAEARARIIDFVFMPTRSNWERVSGLVVNESGTTLEAATRASGGYDPDAHIPSHGRALLGLEAAALNEEAARA